MIREAIARWLFTGVQQAYDELANARRTLASATREMEEARASAEGSREWAQRMVASHSRPPAVSPSLEMRVDALCEALGVEVVAPPAGVDGEVQIIRKDTHKRAMALLRAEADASQVRYILARCRHQLLSLIAERDSSNQVPKKPG